MGVSTFLSTSHRSSLCTRAMLCPNTFCGYATNQHSQTSQVYTGCVRGRLVAKISVIAGEYPGTQSPPPLFFCLTVFFLVLFKKKSPPPQKKKKKTQKTCQEPCIMTKCELRTQKRSREACPRQSLDWWTALKSFLCFLMRTHLQGCTWQHSHFSSQTLVRIF